MSDDDWTRLARRMSEISEAPLFVVSCGAVNSAALLLRSCVVVHGRLPCQRCFMYNLTSVIFGTVPRSPADGSSCAAEAAREPSRTC